MVEFIHLFLYFWHLRKASLTGTAIKEVECEQCRQQYVYVMERTVTEARPTERWAEKKAKRLLDNVLIRGCDVVPCPECGWVQTSMIRKQHRAVRRNLPLPVVLLGLVWLAPLTICVALAAGRDPASQSWAVGWGIGAAVCFLAAVIAIIWHYLSAGRWDPNREDAEQRIATGNRLARRLDVAADPLGKPTDFLLELPGKKSLARQLNPNLVPESWARALQPLFTEEKTDGAVTLTGRVLREVECEACGEEFVYLLERTRQLNPKTSLPVPERMKEVLESELSTDFDYVPCPACGWYQSYMVEDDRGQKREHLVVREWVGAGIAFVGGCVLLGIFLEGLHLEPPPPCMGLMVLGALFGPLAVVWGILKISSHRKLSQHLNTRDVEKRIRRGRRLARLRSEILGCSEDESTDQG